MPSVHSADISIVIPTIKGREDWIRKAVRTYTRETPGAEIIVVEGEPSCGEAWQKGYEQSTKEYVHFTADDIAPAPHWYSTAMSLLNQGIVPACNVKDGNNRPALCDSPLGLMGHHPNVLVPFLTREMLEKGGWLLPIHYGSDDWVTYRAAELGYPIQLCLQYIVWHHVAPEGRDYVRRKGDVEFLAQTMEEHGYLPPIYDRLRDRLKISATGLDSVRLKELGSPVDGSIPLVRAGPAWELKNTFLPDPAES